MLLSTQLLKSHFTVAVTVFSCPEIGAVCVPVYKDASQRGHFLKIEMYLIYIVVLIPSIQQWLSYTLYIHTYIHIYIYIYIYTLFFNINFH